MNEDDINPKPGIPLSRLLFSAPGMALIVAIASLVLSTFTFRLARPESNTQAREYATDLLRRESRIWQDPTEVIPATIFNDISTNQLKAFYASAEENWKSIREEMLFSKKENQTNAVVFVIDHSSPYSHGIESRLRTRTAILSAMREVGFTKRKADETDFVLLDAPFVVESSTNDLQNHAPKPFNPLPYEVFHNDTIGNQISPFGKVLVFWISEKYLDRSPWLIFHSILDKLFATTPESKPKYRATAGVQFQVGILGPRTSDGLYFLVRDEALKDAKTNGTSWQLLDYAQIISTSARAPDAFYPYGATNPVPLRSRFGAERLLTNYLPNVSVIHYGSTDDALCFAIAAEMRLRGVDVTKDTILLISEYDTVYGRSLPLTFEAVVKTLVELHPNYLAEAKNAVDLLSVVHQSEGDGSYSIKYSSLMSIFERNLWQIKTNQTARSIKNVKYFTYLAGLDGTKTTADNPKASESQSPSKTEDIVDQPSGEQQLDHIRRLAYLFSMRARSEYNAFPDISDVKAVGLLGSDVFDKMLMLQALKEQIPKCLFFTTELDASFTMRNQTSWTRNLITAAGFNLLPPSNVMTNDSLRFTPFRDSYATAEFVGCLGFLERTRDLPRASVDTYEIGRTVIHALPNANTTNSQNAQSYWSDFLVKQYHLSQNIFNSPALAAGVSICLLVILAAAFPSRHTIKMHWLKFLLITGIVFAALVFVLFFLYSDGLETIEFLDGVSTIPSVLLILLVFPVCGYGFFKTCTAEISERVSGNFAFLFSFVAGLALFGGVSFFEVNDGSCPVRSLHPNWIKAVVISAWVATGLLCVISSFFWRFFLKKLGQLTQEVPECGSKTHLSSDEVLRLCRILKDAMELSWNVEAYGPLSYFPMFSLLLLIIASSSLLDSWHLTIGLSLLAVAGVLILLVSPVLVQRRATEFKRLLEYRIELDRLGGSLENAARVDSNVSYESAVQGLNRGCFAPISQQPVLGALAALIGGSGLVTLLQLLLSK